MAYTPLSGSNQLGGSTADRQTRAGERGNARRAKEIEDRERISHIARLSSAEECE